MSNSTYQIVIALLTLLLMSLIWQCSVFDLNWSGQDLEVFGYDFDSEIPGGHKENSLSVVVATRIDKDYGGNSTRRFLNMIRNTSRSFMNQQVIVVDWGSEPEGLEYLRSILEGLKNVELVHVSSNITSRFPFFQEYLAKNVGIRHATKKHVLAVNQDALFTPEMANFLRFGQLSELAFYRTSRIDDNQYKRKPIRWSGEPSTNICVQKCDRRERLPEFFDGDHYKKCRRVHAGASGDFIMTTKNNWLRVKGFQETGTNEHLDSIQLFKFTFFGLGELWLPLPCTILHQHHVSGRNGRYNTKGPKDSINAVHDCVKKFLTQDNYTKRCFLDNPFEWGLINFSKTKNNTNLYTIH